MITPLGVPKFNSAWDRGTLTPPLFFHIKKKLQTPKSEKPKFQKLENLKIPKSKNLKIQKIENSKIRKSVVVVVILWLCVCLITINMGVDQRTAWFEFSCSSSSGRCSYGTPYRRNRNARIKSSYPLPFWLKPAPDRTDCHWRPRQAHSKCHCHWFH